jgi:hypothetical protein
MAPADRLQCVLLIVAEHTRSDNPYRLLYSALSIDEPEEPRTKPSCCDAEGQPPINLDLVERFERGLRDLGGYTLPASAGTPGPASFIRVGSDARIWRRCHLIVSFEFERVHKKMRGA